MTMPMLRSAGLALALALGASPAAAQSGPPAPPAPGSTLPPDSVRPAARVAVPAPPANAVALCADGVFIVPPGDAAECAAHRGLKVTFTRSAAPTRPVVTRTLTPAPGAARSIAPAPPAGATMQCKDGTFLSGAADAGRCAGHGGLAAILPTRTIPPPPRP